MVELFLTGTEVALYAAVNSAVNVTHAAIHSKTQLLIHKNNFCKERNFRRRKISYFSVQNLSYGF